MRRRVWSATAQKPSISSIRRFRAEHRIDGDRELGFPAGGHAPHAPFEVAGGLQQVTAFLEEFGAGLGQFDARAEALEQLHAQVFLEFGDGVGNRRGHPEQLLGGGRKRAAAGDGVDGEQGIQAEFEHAAMITRRTKKVFA